MTIRMIAEKCGCSAATVSKALNGAEDVSRETAERVRRVAAELGYMPNAAARSMRTSRSYSFGVLFRDNADTGLAHEFFSGLLNGFKRQRGGRWAGRFPCWRGNGRRQSPSPRSRGRR